MANTSKRPLRHTSPRGVFAYPWLSKADTKFNAGGVYKVDLILEGEAAEAMTAKLDRLLEDAKAELMDEVKPAKKKSLKIATPYAMECDDDGDETGRVVVKFKQNATIKKKDGSTIKIGPIPAFDAKGTPIKEAVYGGSEGKVSFSCRPYYNAKDNEIGLTRDLNAVQVLELKSGGGRDASAYGFEEEEGFESSAANDTFGEDQTDGDEDAGEDEDEDGAAF